MSTLRTTFHPDTDDDQSITVVSLRALDVSSGDALDGLRLSPGVVVVLPHKGACYLQIDSDIVEVSPEGGVVVSGYSQIRLSDAYTGHNGVLLSIIEIGATVNETSRLKDFLQLPYLIDTNTCATLSRMHQKLIELEETPQDTGGGRELTRHLIAGQTVSALLALAQETDSVTVRTQKETSQISKLKKFLFNNLHRKITTEDMAAVVGFSRDHFCVWAKSQLGKPPASFLRELRMERSLDRLLNSNESIESISEQVGYADRYHFGKEFKKHFGSSPARLRKEEVRKDNSYISKVDLMLTLHRAADALVLCKEGLMVPDINPMERNHLKFLTGHCLKLTGDYSEAMTVWQELLETELGWRAGMRRCELAFEFGEIETALAEMSRLWRADPSDHSALIQLWIQHATILRTQRSKSRLRKYLDFRKEYFIDDQSSEMAALVSLRGIGNDLEILDQCPSSRRACFLALRRCGLFKRAIAEYGDEGGTERIARIYVESGDYERVLKLKPLIPKHCVQAMIQMGMASEAIAAFPEDSAQAYIALGKYAELLEVSQEVNLERVYAHIALGRLKELDELLVKGSYHQEWAQCYLDPEAVLIEGLPDINGHVCVAQILTAIKRLTEGHREDAISLLNRMDSVSSPDFWPWVQHTGGFVLVSVLRKLLDQDIDLGEDLQMVCQDHRYLNRQTLYYDAAYLRGDIDADEYFRQPKKEQLNDRWSFIRSLADDLSGNSVKACEGYREFLGNTMDFEHVNLIKHRFSKWRLMELENKKGRQK